MKCKIFTFFCTLLFFIFTGTRVYSATITANSGLVGANWSDVATWIGGVVPTLADDVVIPAGDSIVVDNSSYSRCSSLVLNGSLFANATFYVSGDITVNTTGRLSLKSNIFCSNIYNYGIVWCPGAAYGGSPKSLYVGYSFGPTGTQIVGTGDYVVVNDGIFGDRRASALANKVGSGIYLYYSNLSKSLTIRPSSPSVTGYSFNIAALLPANAGTSTQDFNLDIQESMALLRTSTYHCFSLQNGDAFPGYSRTCTIAAGDTVFVGGLFHTKASAPNVDQGNITYNVYGCLDFVTCNPNKSEMDLYATSYAGNSSTLKINVGDGTATNAGSLVLGRAITLNRSLSSQNIAVNLADYSSVVFGYSTIPTFQCLTAGVTDYSIFPSSYYNLSINNTAGVPIPSSGAISVRNALTLTAGKLTLGNYDLIASSISGGSSSNYVVTSGTGKLGISSFSTTTTLPIGSSASAYAPVVIVPTAATSFSARVGASHAGTAPDGYALNAEEWVLSPGAASSVASVALTPSVASYTTSPSVFYGDGASSYSLLPSSSYSSGTYTASAITDYTNPFTTGGASATTSIVSAANNNISVSVVNNKLVVDDNVGKGAEVSVYALAGVKSASKTVVAGPVEISLLPGIYIVKAGSKTSKVIIK